MKVLNEEQQKEIVGSRYDYYAFTKENIEAIASKKVTDLVYKEGATLVQALYPNNLICSGLFDNFLIFECSNGKRTDPPLVAFSNIDNKELCKKIIDFFKKEKIKYHESWDKLYAKIK